MFSSSALIVVGGAVFGGVAFAWVLPPTTPIGGLTISEISRHTALAGYSVVPSVGPLPDQAQAQPSSQPAVYDPQLPPISLDSRPHALAYRAVPVTQDASEVGNDYGPRPYADDYDRAFRIGYRQAKRQGFATPDDCEQFADSARGDGCRKYLDDHEPPALDYDAPTT